MSAVAKGGECGVGASDLSPWVQKVFPRPQALECHIHDFVTFTYQPYYFFFLIYGPAVSGKSTLFAVNGRNRQK